MFEEILVALRRFRFHFANETDLQLGIARALTDAGIEFEREKVLTDADRIDFLIGRIGLEVKVDASRAQVIRQLHRYANSPDIDGLILVTTQARHAMPPKMIRKTLCVFNLAWDLI